MARVSHGYTSHDGDGGARHVEAVATRGTGKPYVWHGGGAQYKRNRNRSKLVGVRNTPHVIRGKTYTTINV